MVSQKGIRGLGMGKLVAGIYRYENPCFIGRMGVFSYDVDEHVGVRHRVRIRIGVGTYVHFVYLRKIRQAGALGKNRLGSDADQHIRSDIRFIGGIYLARYAAWNL